MCMCVCKCIPVYVTSLIVGLCLSADSRQNEGVFVFSLTHPWCWHLLYTIALTLPLYISLSHHHSFSISSLTILFGNSPTSLSLYPLFRFSGYEVSYNGSLSPPFLLLSSFCLSASSQQPLQSTLFTSENQNTYSQNACQTFCLSLSLLKPSLHSPELDVQHIFLQRELCWVVPVFISRYGAVHTNNPPRDVFYMEELFDYLWVAL